MFLATEAIRKDILADIGNSKWTNISIELCGGTHVSNTGEIEALIITEESGVVKGIRRITAVIGSEARGAANLATELDANLSRLEATTPNLSDLKTLTSEVAQTSISVIKKAELKQRLAILRKSVQKRLKDSQVQYLNTGVNKIHLYFQTNPGAESYVGVLDTNGNPSALHEIISRVKTLDKALYLFSVDAAGSKVAHANYIPLVLREKAASGKIWMETVMEHIGGRNWGDHESTQGINLKPNDLVSAIGPAKEYLLGFT
ncbi:hypothetical protein DFH07DRAFT_943145 [Mycena maculata]|uniref:alanine--tRNA ligase n=1 Tax=Mycena maculata TaxID=230809 RepID=A0AAD7N3G9_9AGAR|nr:hypothetical protein DFH07DRAFT_943145 [Mycena maculata]